MKEPSEEVALELQPSWIEFASDLHGFGWEMDFRVSQKFRGAKDAGRMSMAASLFNGNSR